MRHIQNWRRLYKMSSTKGVFSSATATGVAFPHIYDSLTAQNDNFFVLPDYDAYSRAQQQADCLYKGETTWSRMSAMNIAHAGQFASEEVIRKYATDIWNVR